MQPGKVDQYIDELIWLAHELKYSEDFVKDKARIGMTDSLRAASAIKTPVPDDYVEYLNFIQGVSHNLEDLRSYNYIVKGKGSTRRNKNDDRPVTRKK